MCYVKKLTKTGEIKKFKSMNLKKILFCVVGRETNVQKTNLISVVTGYKTQPWITHQVSCVRTSFSF